jgi:formate dehydrogenase maturation protein FdhE
MNKALICPVCGGGDLKEIIYGLPDPESFDFEKYEVGGCCVTDEDVKYKCLICDSSW